MNKNKTSIHLHTCIRLDWLVDEADTAETSIHLHTCIRHKLLFRYLSKI